MKNSQTFDPPEEMEPKLKDVPAARGHWRNIWANFRRRRLAFISLILVAFIYLLGIFAPVIQTHDYQETNLRRTQQGPSTENWFGTDRAGRDLYTRVVWGIQTTVIITVTSFATGSLLLGVTIGLVAGYFRGWVDAVIMRVGEVVSAFPDILLIILLAATLRPRIVEFARSVEDSTGMSGLVSSGIVDYVVIGIALLPLSWFGMMRLVRGQVLVLREAEYVEAARAMGTSTPRILFRHILPNVVSPIIVSVSFGIGAIALSEVVLSFFGLGVQPPRPSLGVMIGEVTARGGASVSVLRDHPEQLLAPIIVVWLLIFCWNIVGDALNDVLNPRAR
ncbi:MAG: ABC transporter permease [Dehalococcoidia bacterium]|jgi:ABC-type dipeptide/oligopeptide/nickel transport system permease subunit|nr:peptide ABC transporter permease [Chloroflexota bacterium]MDP6056815.1 ABC transporter permease [Dehalococcoidia bacterium]MDP7089892.1 ABC transporter permease [Dehalococcoidia bacterium]MDP7261525.1 ABC transporter permease [Dehalococcoidia bacterium]MDP7486035.1 ABC transporter permease [Dehalococcoidia bacterium]|tara:strand:- start:8145 stop:9146 length:1002 start_codon:yes stop_codon:yes gene_type:complete